MIYTAVCGSQLQEISGNRDSKKYIPHALGHEASGYVIDKNKSVTKVKINRKDQAVKLANELSSVTETVFAAQRAYAEKGFEVIIETSSESGLITKWKLKIKRKL